MSIIALFCEVQEFFLAHEKWEAARCLPKETPPETHGRPRCLHTSEVMTLLSPFIKVGIGRSNIFTKDMSAFTTAPSFQIW